MTRTSESPRRVLLVGATQGLGLALAGKYLQEGWHVRATTITPSADLQAFQARHPGQCIVHRLDITDRPAVAALARDLEGEALDVLHVVAGAFQSTFAPIWAQPDAEILRLLQTNAIGGVRLAEALASRVRDDGTFVFTSSGMGSLARNDRGDVDLYRISKAALNMLVRSFAARRQERGQRVLLLCPGWAKTAMGGPEATVEVSTSVDGMYRIVSQPATARVCGAQFLEYSGDVVPW